MPTIIADYTVIRNAKTTLEHGKTKNFTFYSCRDMVKPNECSDQVSQSPVLSFFADPSPDAEALRCTIEINGTKIIDYTYSGGVSRAHYEAINYDDIDVIFTDSETPNTIEFRCVSGEGSISFSDIILWYQRWI